MEDNSKKIDELFKKLDLVLKEQKNFSKEITDLKAEIAYLKYGERTQTEEDAPLYQEDEFVPNVKAEPSPIPPKPEPPKAPTPKRPVLKRAPKKPSKPFFELPNINFDWEKFIGENLINKIGILILVIGVFIGAKWSIENNLISPLTRIIFGYVASIALLGFGMKLKKNYLNYSAVLVSGAMAIMYFITYAAYSYYGFLPQVVAFGLMALFTIFTVVAALNYDKQIIAHLGLVGAYAVPFLLSSGSGQVGVLFSYMALINIGVLFIAFKKYWKPLYYSAFVMTWLIYTFWWVSEYSRSKHFMLALIFLTIFFITFYVIFLAFKLIKHKKFVKSDIILVLINSFLFYGIGYLLLEGHSKGEQFLGVFTLINAIIHFVVSTIVYKRKLADRSLFYLVAGLVLTFITMAFPVQMDGNWVTLFWAAEAALLFWIGRSRGVSFYEKMSYPLMFLAMASLFQDWETGYRVHSYGENIDLTHTPLLNINFLTSVLVTLAFLFINYINRSKKYISFLDTDKGVWQFMRIAMPSMLIILIYTIFKVEIDAYWDQLYYGSQIEVNSENNPYTKRNMDYQNFKGLWTMNYSMLFLAILSFINIYKLKIQELGFVNILLNIVMVILFLSGGLYILSELRESYLETDQHFRHSVFNVIVRYISFVFFGGLMLACYKYARAEFIKYDLRIPFEIMLHVAILWVISSELLHWMDMAGSSNSYKLGLSILWGLYALLLVSLGIWKQKKYLRVGGIALFAVTLAKLAFYDLTHLNTISKTIVLISLGVLLLIISFLYNKFSANMGREGENES